MKKIIILLISILQLASCKAQKTEKNNPSELFGKYHAKKLSQKIEIKPDGSFILYNATSSGHYDIQKCEYASKGKWTKINNNLIEITSEDNYLKEKGFELKLTKLKKLSDDSLYIEIKYPKELFYNRGQDCLTNNFYFNNDISKGIRFTDTIIKIEKKKHLWDKSIPKNFISFYIDANPSGTKIYRSRIMFSIFEDYIDTEKYNYLTFELPNFDLCFFELESYNQELIYLDKKKLQWQGEIWELEAK